MFAVNSGFKTLTTKLGAKRIDLGAERKVVRMDYGVPCERPRDAAAIEAEALKLTASEEAAINRAQQHAAILADREAQAAQKLQPSEEAAIVRAQQDAAAKQAEAATAVQKVQDYL